MQAATQRTIDASPTFMEYGLAKNIAAWAHANCDPNKQEDWIQFCMKRLRTLKSFKIFKSEIKKLKTFSAWCPFKGLSNDTTHMQIQSGRTVLTWERSNGIFIASTKVTGCVNFRKNLRMAVIWHCGASKYVLLCPHHFHADKDPASRVDVNSEVIGTLFYDN